jgi:hypothetical protein
MRSMAETSSSTSSARYVSAASGSRLLGRAALVGHHDRHAARDRLGQAEAERLVGASVEHHVGAREHGSEAAPIALESGERHVGRPPVLLDAALHARTLGAVAEEHEHAAARLRSPAVPCERVDQHVPAFLDGEPADRDEEWSRHAGEQLAARSARRARRGRNTAFSTPNGKYSTRGVR